MKDLNTAHDDSMEDILASIRRIIADDGAPAGQEGHARTAAPGASHGPIWRREAELASAPSATGQAREHALQEDDGLEILELSEEFLVNGDDVFEPAGYGEPAAPAHANGATRDAPAYPPQEAPSAKWRLWDGQAPVRAPVRSAETETAAPGGADASRMIDEAEPEASFEAAAVELEAAVAEANAANGAFDGPPAWLREPAAETQPPAPAAGPDDPFAGIPVPPAAQPANMSGPARAAQFMEEPPSPAYVPPPPASARAPARPVWSRRAADNGAAGNGAAAPNAAPRPAAASREPAASPPPPPEFQPVPEPVRQAEPKAAPIPPPAAAPMPGATKPDFRVSPAANAQTKQEPAPRAEEAVPPPPEHPASRLEDFTAMPEPQPRSKPFAGFDDEEDDSSLPPERSYLKTIAAELARATIGSLGDKELRNAKKVDFTQLAGGPEMAAVTNSFASVLSDTSDARHAEAPSAVQEPELPTEAHPPARVAVAQALPAAARTNAGASLEEGFRELLRPMILQWLDENMPRLLDEAVQQEVRRRMGER